jgi:hypothetical protein
MLGLLNPFVAGSAVAQTTPISGADALAQDAAAWAAISGVAADTALRHLNLQAASVPVTDALTLEFADRLAGLAIDHEPAFRVVATLVGDDPVPDRVAFAGDQAINVTFRTGAPATRAALLTALERHQPALRAALPHAPGLGVDPRLGVLVAMIPTADIERASPGHWQSILSGIAGVPVEVRAVDRDRDLAVEGGARVVGVNPADGRRYACTTGFTVTDGARTGIVTAAHCPDTLTYVDADRGEVPLTFAGQWGWGHQDVQLNLADPADPPPGATFFADTAKTILRSVETVGARASTRAGDIVCHRGERTGYSCAEVEMVDFAPAGDLCGGACKPTWVAVAGPGCKAGDSGGPVFIGTTALGIVKGGSYRADGRCSFYYYMSTDYLPEGWRLITVPPPR